MGVFDGGVVGMGIAVLHLFSGTLTSLYPAAL